MFTIRTFTKALAVSATALVIISNPLEVSAATSSGITITNTASVDYEVGGINQVDKLSNTASFVVDAKVDLTVAGTGGNNLVTPDTTGQAIKFTVTNTGNETFDISLAMNEITTDDFNVTSATIYVDNGDGSYGAGDLATTTIDNLLPGVANAKVVFIVGDIPNGNTVADNEVATYHLRATALLASGGVIPAEPASDTPGSKDYVYADAQGSDTANDSARDKIHSASLNFEVDSATIVVDKSSTVDDGLTGPSDEFYIPGGTVTYTIKVTNNGTQAADAVVLTDAPPTNTTFVNNSVTVDSTSHNDNTGPVAVDGSDNITVTLGTIAGGGAFKTVTFQVTID